MSKANLRAANLSSTNLVEANLSRANLAGANLSRANLAGANLSKANLNGANLQKANLIPSDLRNTELENVRMQGAIYSDNTLFPANFNPQSQGAYLIAANANIENIDIRDLDLSSLLELESVNMKGATYNEITLFPANFNPQNQGAYLIGANSYLKGALLSTANLQFANLQQANLRGADLSNANLQKANLSHANLLQANLRDAQLQQANLAKAIYNEQTQLPDKLDMMKTGAYLVTTGAQLLKLNLPQSDLSYLLSI